MTYSCLLHSCTLISACLPTFEPTHTIYVAVKSSCKKDHGILNCIFNGSLFTVPLHVENPLDDVVIKSLTLKTIHRRKIFHTWEEMGDQSLKIKACSACSQQQVYLKVTPASFHICQHGRRSLKMSLLLCQPFCLLLDMLVINTDVVMTHDFPLSQSV